MQPRLHAFVAFVSLCWQCCDSCEKSILTVSDLGLYHNLAENCHNFENLANFTTMALNLQYEAIGKGFVQQYYALFDDPNQRPTLANMYNVSSPEIAKILLIMFFN